MKSLIAAVLITCLVNEVAGSGVAWLRFITYNNPRGKGNNGHCCDGRSFFCERRGCDHYFKICLDRSGGSDSIVDCSVAEVSTGSVTDRDRITFGESIGSTANPITLPFEQWQSNGRLKIEVWDHDGRSSDDFVDRLSIRLSQTPASSLDSAPIARLDMIARTTLVLELKVACDVNWYGTGCDVYCRPRDDHLGHYDCHRETGVKLCVAGWGGSDCNRNIDECQSSPCQNDARCVDILNGYMCVCADGFEGIYCDANIDDCQAEQCLNGATCLDGVAQFTCACAEGFTGHLCETNIDECLSSPCEHDSTCQDLINGFQCTCSDGFVGERCQTEVDECLSQPCLNGGFCQDMTASYNCSCISGFTGTQCEIDIDECSSDPCHGELSECVDQVNGFQCICPLHRRGPACAIVINWCDSSPCHNNATCESFHDSFTCTCPSGWAGALCSEDVDECASSPCHYNQTCLDFVDGYLCNCSASYTGLSCEVDVDECALDYCQNNATCENSVGSYECLCSEDWFGQNCESMVNYCESEPCQNNATCVPVVGGVECQCQPGWTGHLCEVNIDDCASQPCQEGATCHDLIGGYTCTCAAGWIGQNCSSEVDECTSNPCLNGGTCTDWPGSYSCSCPLGYTGFECQTEHACWSAPCQNGGTCIERVDNGTDYHSQNKTGECYECKCDVGVMGLNCEDVIFMIVNGTITFPSFTKKDEYEHSGILLTRTVTDKEAAMMVTKLKEPLANFLQLRSDDFTMGYRNSRCHGFNDSEEIGILVFWAEVKRVPIPWSVVDLALDDTQQLEQLLGVPVYEGEGCAPVVDKVEMATPEWYTSYWFMSLVGGLVLLVLAIIIVVGVTRRRKKPRDGARLLNVNPLYDFKRVPTPMENIINSDVNSVNQNGLYSSEEGIGNPAYQEVGVNGIYDVPRRLNESFETKTEQLIE